MMGIGYYNNINNYSLLLIYYINLNFEKYVLNKWVISYK